MSDAYEIAKAGGKHAGMLKNYSDMPVNKLEKGVRRLNRQIEDHCRWIASPGSKLPDGLDQRRVDHLINKKWPDDIARLEEERDILLGLIREKKR